LQIANSQGIPIYTIDQSNLNAVLPQLQLDEDTIADIVDAVDADKEVTVSKTNITFNGWGGCGFIVFDPDTGSGVYMISGGLCGSLTPHDKGMLALGSIFLSLSAVTGALAVLAFSIAGPIAALIFGMMSWLYFCMMIISLYGEENAREFVMCLYLAIMDLWLLIENSLARAAARFGYYVLRLLHFEVFLYSTLDDAKGISRCAYDLYGGW
ncbi:MAG: hypothetical protein AB1634_18730, partial [Thermodesulfobacteriota bacterium]